jgi:hypothetical protein
MRGKQPARSQRHTRECKPNSIVLSTNLPEDKLLFVHTSSTDCRPTTLPLGANAPVSRSRQPFRSCLKIYFRSITDFRELTTQTLTSGRRCKDSEQ